MNIPWKFCLNLNSFQGDIEENVSGCFFNETQCILFATDTYYLTMQGWLMFWPSLSWPQKACDALPSQQSYYGRNLLRKLGYITCISAVELRYHRQKGGVVWTVLRHCVFWCQGWTTTSGITSSSLLTSCHFVLPSLSTTFITRPPRYVVVLHLNWPTIQTTLGLFLSPSQVP